MKGDISTLMSSKTLFVCKKIVASSIPRVAPITFNVPKGGMRERMVFIQKDVARC